jgi:hypothetical protein
MPRAPRVASVRFVVWKVANEVTFRAAADSIHMLSSYYDGLVSVDWDLIPRHVVHSALRLNLPY